MRKKSVAVTEISEVAVCERRVYLRAKLGQRTTPELEQRKISGRVLHERAYQQRAPDRPDRRCFIASALYGPDAWQTVRLRQFRDERLLTRCYGRIAVRVYYLLSPAAVRLSKRWPAARAVAKKMLDALVRRLG